MINPEVFEDTTYSMKTKCESLMKFVNKIEAYNVIIFIVLKSLFIFSGRTNIFIFKRNQRSCERKFK